MIGKTYTDTSELRYGTIMLMTDQDHDGSHIKGLLLNFIHYFWPSLLKLSGFVKEFVTPIIKATRGHDIKTFFTLTDYERWARTSPSGYKIKYYKGLGTSTSLEAKEYFKAITSHVISFKNSVTKEDIQDDSEAMNLAFNKSQADARKDWLSNYSKEKIIDHTQSRISIRDFVDKELIHFSVADNHRSIPSLVDGLKPGQRKILFGCFKRLHKGSKKLS
jgi:DNA topoisomerase II